MSLKRISLAGALAIAGVGPKAMAQDLAVPAVPPAAAAPVAGATTVNNITTGSPQTLWNFLGISRSGHAACKERLCNSQIGQLMNNGLAPLSGISGGLIPQFCPPVPSANQLSNLEKGLADGTASSSQVQAAKIQREEAGAKARVQAVEYLGTVDCNYFKDARKALLDSLRTDTNECVRYAAARVLANGCCCGKDTIRALTTTVMGMAAVIDADGKTTDGSPAETSERVRCAAMIALQNCLSSAPPEPIVPTPVRDIDEGPERPVAPELPPTEGPLGRSASVAKTRDEIRRAAYERDLEKLPMKVVIRDAERALAIFGKINPAPFSTGRRTLANAISQALTAPVAVAANTTDDSDAEATRSPAPAAGPEASVPTETAPTESPAPRVEEVPTLNVPPAAPLADPTVPMELPRTAPMELPPLPPGLKRDETPATGTPTAPPVMERTPDSALPESKPSARASEPLNLPRSTEAARPVTLPAPVARRYVAPPARTARTNPPATNRVVPVSYNALTPPRATRVSATPAPQGLGQYSDYERFTRDTSAYRYDPLP